MGLDAADNRLLEILTKRFSGKPVGLTTLASALSEDPDTVEDVYEPYLMQQGLMVRTPKGASGDSARFRARGLAASGRIERETICFSKTT